MSELLTLSKSDPRFEDYLLGTFSKESRALPVQSLNVNTNLETVTFQITPISKIEKPSWIQLIFQLFKVHSFIFVLFPLFIILVKTHVDEDSFDPILAVLSSMGAVALLTAVNLRNDFRDHMSGLDRVHPSSGSRAIQKGWVTAKAVRTLSNVFLVFGIIFGLPAVVVYPELLLFIGAFALFLILGLSYYNNGLKYRLLTEVASFLLFGPLLTVGFQMGIGAGFDIEAVYIGTITGWFSVYTLHVKNFEAILVNSQAHFESTITKLGFENGKRLLVYWWLAFIVFFNVYHIYFSATAWSWLFIGISAIMSWRLLNVLSYLKTPVGSAMAISMDKCRRIGLIIITLWILENMTYVLVMEFGT